MGLWCDIQRMIELRSDALLDNFTTLIKPDYIVGDNDEEAKVWLVNVAKQCVAHMNFDENGNPS